MEAWRELLVEAALEAHRGLSASDVRHCGDELSCLGCYYLEAAMGLSKALRVLRGGSSAVVD